MKIYYVSATLHPEDYSALFFDSSQMTGQQIQKFHQLLINGFAMNGGEVRVISCAPINRQDYSRLFYLGGKRKTGLVSYRYIPTVNFPVIKNVLNMCGAFLEVLKMGREDVVVCDVLNASVALAAVMAARLRKTRCVGIVTDLPQLQVSDEEENSGFAKMVYRVIAGCTHYVFLTEQMNAILNPGEKPYIVVEGLCDKEMALAERGRRDQTPKCVYAGYLHARYGVKDMVDGFVSASVPGAELHIYGYGSYADELKEVCEANSNVVYHGTVPNKEVVMAETEADLLINPRPTHEEFTKYSFPSKNMEYMASGTAVLTTKLPGMPEEYYPYIYLIEEESAEGLKASFKSVLGLSREERDAKGAAAKDFVMNKKSNKAQAERVLEFLRVY